MGISMDKFDQHLLELLQQDGRLSTVELAERVGLSASPCARRLKKLEQQGVIEGYSALLNRQKIGIAMTVFVEVSLSNHQAQSIDKFESEIVEMKQVVSCHVVSGAYDYLLEVVSQDLNDYELFIRQLQCVDNVKDIHTHMAMRQVKGRASLPILN